MGVNIKQWCGVVMLTTLMSATGSAVFAEESNGELSPLSDTSIFEAVDRNGDIDAFWDNISVTGDAKDFFGFGYAENSIEKNVRRLEVLYKDLMATQERSQPTLRTRDLRTPFSTSAFELQNF